MDPNFWLDRWQNGRTGWHEPEPNHLLVRHFKVLGLPPGARVFVPLCGASPDIGWLLAQGRDVAGAELSAVAVAQLFQSLTLTPEITQSGPMQRYSAPGIDIFVGDIFDLTVDMLGPIHAIHDRAALFALPPQVRAHYAKHLVALTGGAPQLLNCLDYGGAAEEGPPYSVTPDEVARLYGPHYKITLLEAEGAEVFSTGASARDDLWLLARP